MPFTYAIDAPHRIVTTSATGVVTMEDILFVRQRLQSDAAFDPQFHQLLDLRAATDIAIAAPSMRRIYGRSVFVLGVRRAFVAETAEQFGIARMFAALSEHYGHDVRVFRDFDLAVAWLREHTPSEAMAPVRGTQRG
ncbi:MAG: hypothetical protein ABJF01_18760 [bacterium]